VLNESRAAVERQEQMGLPTVMLVPAQLRDLLARFLKRAVPNLRVISHDEVPDFKTIRVTLIGRRKRMNIRKFIAPTAREALREIRSELGEEAVILSNRTTSQGVANCRHGE